MSGRLLAIDVETFPVAGTFTISRGSRREATVVVVTLRDGGYMGRGECVPYARYGETVESVVAQIRTVAEIRDQEELQRRLPAGAARNAVDCALWDLSAKLTGHAVNELADVPAIEEPQLTCYTLSLAAPEIMAAAAKAASDKPLLKLKLGGDGDAERLVAVREARPHARLVADANEAWSSKQLARLLAVARENGVELIEQPLPTGCDGALRDVEHLVPICADESAHTAADVAQLVGLYDAVNIKLDKAGGLSGALVMARAAKEARLRIMIGCMLSTSLAMAPALTLAPFADWLDLDGPLLLAMDRAPAISYAEGRVSPAPRALWG